jgi:hypothetical protein
MLWSEIHVVGHRQLNQNKACPSFDVPTWLEQIKLGKFKQLNT